MYLNTTDVDELAAAAASLAPRAEECVLLLIGESSPPDVPGLGKALAARDIAFVGGIFPGVTYGERKYDNGVVLAKLPVLVPPCLIADMGAASEDLGHLAEAAESSSRRPTALIFADGLSPDISPFLQSLYDQFGNSVNYLGGGAGSLSLEPMPCVFTSSGFVQNGAVIALLDLESRLGVRHGWQRLAGPIVATAATQNKVRELNWEEAFGVYSTAVTADCGREIRADNFFEIAKGYPFGMFKEDHEDIIRDPIRVTDSGSIVCVGEVPQNTVLHIMKGEPGSLIAAAAQAARDSARAAPGRAHSALLVDCISRVIFLEEEFEKELAAAVEEIRRVAPEQTPVGVLSLGEISSYGDGYLEFFNKTIVVGLLGD